MSNSDNIRVTERGLPAPDPRPLLQRIENRLVAVEAHAKKPETKTWAFWISVAALIIGAAGLVIALLRH